MTRDRPETAPLGDQVLFLAEVLNRNPVVQAVLSLADEMNLPDWYLAAGGVSQTVWNLRHGFEVAEGIKDYDVVYFDPDADPAAEEGIEREFRERLAAFGVEADVNNEAFVHLWYGERFGKPIGQYHSTGHAISTWPTTASAVGVRSGSDGYVVCAPYGLADLLGMVARPNKVIVTQEVYEDKTRQSSRPWSSSTARA